MKTSLPPILNRFLLLLVLLFINQATFGHTINYALEKAPASDVAVYYTKLGMLHIIPYGLDHILFVVGLCLLNSKFKPILWQATAFTVAHSVTLALSVKGIVTLPSDIVEPIISLSILFIAIENLILKELQPWRIILVFFFGLIHGLGFASALNEIGLPRNQFFTSIFFFNVGVELAQIAIIAFVFFGVAKPLGHKTWFRRAIVCPLSVEIAIIALYWTVERVFTI